MLCEQPQKQAEPLLIQYDSGLERLRGLAKQDCPAWNDEAGPSAPAYLKQALGIDSSNEGFPALLRAFRRFLKSEGNLRSHPELRAALLEHYREEVPDLDILDFSVYGREQEACAKMHAAAKVFYHIPDDRTNYLAPRITGRYFFYKRLVDARRTTTILRSYAIIGRPTPAANFLMLVELQRATYSSPEIGQTKIHDFYAGICSMKDCAIVMLTSQVHTGAVKHLVFDNLHADSKSHILHRAYGTAIETCDGYSATRTARSPCAMLRIPDNLKPGEIEARINTVPANEVDEIIADYIIGA